MAQNRSIIDDDGLPSLRRILRTARAATYIGLSSSSLEKMRLVGSGPRFIHLGGRAVGYDLRDLDVWLEQQRQSGPNNAPARSQD